MIPPDEVTFIKPANLSPRHLVRICLMALRFIWLTGTPVLQVWWLPHPLHPAKGYYARRCGALAA
ncbi:hypothetical protein KCP75_14320 [Salmonella enterica subsp. enterica]|nr:hypothetical protein KCP75_14320 [Salmonella enterica subsp. enterica]